MNLKLTILFSVVAAGASVGFAQDTGGSSPARNTGVPAPAAAPAPAKPAFDNTQVVEEIGWLMGQRMNLHAIEFTQPEIDAFVKGLTSAAGGKDSPYDMKEIQPLVQEFMGAKQEAYITKMKAASEAENSALFAKLKENKNVVQLPDGLCYEVLTPGEGPYPSADDTVKVNYTGKLANGTVFDTSEGKGPAEFQLKDVIRGWAEGIQKINKGGKIRLYVPPALGYGEHGQPGIPPNSALVFDVDLLDIVPPSAHSTPAPSPAPGK